MLRSLGSQSVRHVEVAHSDVTSSEMLNLNCYIFSCINGLSETETFTPIWVKAPAGQRRINETLKGRLKHNCVGLQNRLYLSVEK